MTTKIEVQGTRLVLSAEIGNAFEVMDAGTMISLADTLACEEHVIRYVMQQVLDGQTEHGSYGRSAFRATETTHTALEAFRREIAKRSGDVAREQITALEDALRYERGEHMKTIDELRKERGY